jgi:xanthine dehydrogenase FAD-binding subunit
MRHVHFPTTPAELLALLAAHPEARLMAGGTDLLVRLRQSIEDERPLLCLERIPELRGIAQTDGGLRIAAATSLDQLATHPLVVQHCPLLARAAATIGGPAIRTMGTLGGNLCTASPAGDTLPALYVLGARLELLSATGVRQLPIAGFITGPGRTRLQHGELLTAVHVPASGAFAIQHFEKVGRRQSLAVAVASLAALIRLEPDGRVAEARLAWGSVGPTVVRSPEAEAALLGQPLTRDALEAAALCARRAVSPIDDLRAGARYRRQLAGNLLLRLLKS